MAWGSWVQILGTDLHTPYQAMLWQHPAYKIEQDGTDVSSGLIFLSKKKKKKLSKFTSLIEIPDLTSIFLATVENLGKCIMSICQARF